MDGDWPRNTGDSMYHGTDDKDFDPTQTNPSSHRFDVCLTWDEDVARMYGERWGTECYIFDIELADDLRVASEEEALAVLGIDADDYLSPADVFHAIDAGLAELEAAGFGAVEYRDQLPGTTHVFETTRVFVEGAITSFTIN